MAGGAGWRQHGDPAAAAPVGLGASAAVSSGRVLARDQSDPAWRAVELAQRGRMILDVAAVDLEAAEAIHGSFHPTTWHFRNAWYEARRSWDRLRVDLGAAKLAAALEEPPTTVLALGPHAGEWTPGRDGRWPLPPESAGPVLLILIGGRTYRVHREAGTPLAPRIWRVARLHVAPSYDHEPPRTRHRPRPRVIAADATVAAASSDAEPSYLDDGCYYACRLHDGGTQCDCAEWIYRVAEPDASPALADGRSRPPAPTECKHLAALAALGWV